MSTTENTTNVIDEKKGEDTSVKPDFKRFMSNYLLSVILTIGCAVFIVGGLGLYTTKVAQSNILPDDIKLAPYTVIDRVVNDKPIDINIMRPNFFSSNENTFSQKAIFNSQEYLDSFNKSFLCSLKEAANPNSDMFPNVSLYFSNVYDHLASICFYLVNSIFLTLGYLPESLIMLLYGFFGIFIWFTIYAINLFASAGIHIAYISQLFRNSSENKKQWEPKENISFFRLNKLILFFCISIPAIISTFVSAIFFTFYGLIAPLYATYSIPNKNKEKKYNVVDFIKDTFAYKTFFFFILATISLFSNGKTYLGTNGIIGIVIAVIFAYFVGLYANPMPEKGVDGFTSKIRQNFTQASVVKPDLSDPKLVQICKSIPIDDADMEEIIQRGKFRAVTNPTGGGDNGNSTMEIKSFDNNQHINDNNNTVNSNPINSNPINSNPINNVNDNNVNDNTDNVNNDLTEKDRLFKQITEAAKNKDINEYNKIRNENIKKINDINNKQQFLKGGNRKITQRIKNK